MFNDELKFKALESISNILICFLDKHHRIMYLSPAWQPFLEHSLDHYCYQEFISLFERDQHFKLNNALDVFYQNKESTTSFTSKLNTIQGIKHFEFFGRATSLENDYQLVLNAHDISKLVRVEQENKKLKIAFDTPSFGYWQLDLGSEELYWSDEIYRIHQVDKADYKPQLDSAIDFYHPEDVDELRNKIDKAMQKAEEWTHTYRLVRPSGEIRNVRVRGNVLLGDFGKPMTVFGICQDITHAQALQEERDILAHAIYESNAGICLLDKNRLILSVNKAFEELTGFTQKEAVGQTSTHFLHGEKTDQNVIQMIRQKLQGGEPVNTDLIYYKKSGEMYWCRLMVTPVISNNELTHFVSFQQDVTIEIEAKRDLKEVNANLEKIIERRTRELIEANRELEHLSRHDALTNTLNRRVFYDIYETESARLKRNDSYLSIAMIDIDHFKLINDSHGHLAGDKVLQSVVNEINSVKRDSDYLFRFGGEEFVLLMPGANLVQSELVAERVRQKIANLVTHESGHEIRVTVSIGLIATNSQTAATHSLKKADELLYQAKSIGRNCIVC